MNLQVQNIGKQFQNGTKALEDVSFQVSQGEFVSVIGSSGAGKTTLFRILNGMMECDSGTILLDGVRLDSGNKREKRNLQKSIGTIYQDFCLVEPSTCLDNVLNACLPDMAFLPSVLGLFGRTRTEEAKRLLERVSLLEKAEEPVKNLSGGQKQRVAIARALMRHPSILLADEPVASLDPVTGRQILTLLKDIQKTEHVTILMNSHNLELSMEFSDRLIGIRDGRIVFDGTPDSLTGDIISRIYQNTAEDPERKEVRP
ncbi:MAG: phosphonate ABC transporter ATP-binding protein [Lachnospiraceae bacterium]|nr:phosphonate ABC transporter ATP-binding protein [Lachnospiraceae bacterium]